MTQRIYHRLSSLLTITFLAILISGCNGTSREDEGSFLSSDENPTIRVMTFNLEDIRTEDLGRPDNPRLIAASAIIHKLQPDILVLNELAFDSPDGLNAARFVKFFLSVTVARGQEATSYSAFMAPSNTGLASGFDLNGDGIISSRAPDVPAAAVDGTPGAQTVDGRAYGNDSWGFGMFEGQYAMAVLVRDGLTIKTSDIRTFQTFKWKDLADARAPVHPESGASWYSDDVWEQFPLSSKSHWDIPVEMVDGTIVHILASHPTPAAFDGPEMRNRLRNRAEIKFWGDYISGVEMMDDSGVSAPLPRDAAFVIPVI